MKGKTSRFVFNRITLSDHFDPKADFEILTSAKQTDPHYGDFSYSKKELEQMATNFNSDILGKEVAVDLNHEREGIALAWMVPGSMTVKESTKMEGEFSLFVKLHRYTPKGEEIIKTGELRYFSVEIQFKVEKFIKKVKKVFKNVIVGLALTNRPVIKDMSPTFSENNNIHNPNSMKDLKELFASLTAKDSVSKKELTEFKTLATEAVKADEAVKKEVESMTSKLSEKIEKDVKTEDEKLKKFAEDAMAKILADKKDKSLSDSDFKTMLAEGIKAAIAEPMKMMNKTLAEAREARLDAEVEKLCLSEDRAVGFKAGVKGKIKEFVKKLSDDLAEEYLKLHEGAIASVDLKVYGTDEAMADFNKVDAYAELDKKATEYADKNNVSYTEASKYILSSDEKLSTQIQALEDANGPNA